ncbi:hypothetical protein EPO17_02810 [Patescibacteria group bacterium]|nr:MAG: hypothetical protein EPO17_02810 [Patescibacteria group bacterium]
MKKPSRQQSVSHVPKDAPFPTSTRSILLHASVLYLLLLCTFLAVFHWDSVLIILIVIKLFQVNVTVIALLYLKANKQNLFWESSFLVLLICLVVGWLFVNLRLGLSVIAIGVFIADIMTLLRNSSFCIRKLKAT